MSDLVGLGVQMHQESAYAFLPFDHAKVRELLVEHIAHPADCFLQVLDVDGRPVGFLMGMLSEYFFSAATIACDEAFFIEPTHRRAWAAIELLRAFRQWAQSRGAAELCLGISTGAEHRRIGRFYERMGLTMVGGIYKQRLT